MEETVRVWDNIERIGEFLKAKNLKVTIDLTTRDGIKYLYLRDWYYRPTFGEWRPGMAGLSIAIEMPIYCEKCKSIAHIPILEDVIEMFTKGLEISKTFPLVDNQKAVWIKKKGK